MRINSILLLGCTYCVSFFLPIAVAAQAWRDAVLIMSAGDSLKGQVEFSDPDISTREVRFRASRESTVITYNTDQVASFHISNPYQRFDKLETSVTYYSNGVIGPGANPIIGIRPMLVFAEVIRSGPTIILYSAFDEDREERFFIRKAGELKELVNISYLIERDAKTYTVKDERYQAQLKSLFGDCLAGQGQSYSYDGRGLGKAVDKYMGCKGELQATGPEQKRRYEQIHFGLFVTGVPTDAGWNVIPGGTLQILSRKNRGNQFIWLNVGGPVSEDLSVMPLYMGLFAGTYIGSGRVQPLINVGVTSMLGTFNGGVGVAYNKRVILSANISRGFEGGALAVNLAVFPRVRPK